MYMYPITTRHLTLTEFGNTAVVYLSLIVVAIMVFIFGIIAGACALLVMFICLHITSRFFPTLNKISRCLNF